MTTLTEEERLEFKPLVESNYWYPIITGNPPIRNISVGGNPTGEVMKRYVKLQHRDHTARTRYITFDDKALAFAEKLTVALREAGDPHERLGYGPGYLYDMFPEVRPKVRVK